MYVYAINRQPSPVGNDSDGACHRMDVALADDFQPDVLPFPAYAFLFGIGAQPWEDTVFAISPEGLNGVLDALEANDEWHESEAFLEFVRSERSWQELSPSSESEAALDAESDGTRGTDDRNGVGGVGAEPVELSEATLRKLDEMRRRVCSLETENAMILSECKSHLGWPVVGEQPPLPQAIDRDAFECEALRVMESWLKFLELTRARLKKTEAAIMAKYAHYRGEQRVAPRDVPFGEPEDAAIFDPRILDL